MKPESKQKIGWVLAIIFLFWWAVGLISSGLDFLGLLLTFVIIVALVEWGPKGLWYFLMAASLLGIMGFPFVILDEGWALGSEPYYVFGGCILFLAVSIFLINRFKLVPPNPLIQKDEEEPHGPERHERNNEKD